MALKLLNLSRMSYGNGMTWFGYRTADSQRDMERPGYWKDASDILKPGDFILASNDWCGILYWVAGAGSSGVWIKRMIDSKTAVE